MTKILYPLDDYRRWQAPRSRQPRGPCQSANLQRSSSEDSAPLIAGTQTCIFHRPSVQTEPILLLLILTAYPKKQITHRVSRPCFCFYWLLTQFWSCALISALCLLSKWENSNCSLTVSTVGTTGFAQQSVTVPQGSTNHCPVVHTEHMLTAVTGIFQKAKGIPLLQATLLSWGFKAKRER